MTDIIGSSYLVILSILGLIIAAFLFAVSYRRRSFKSTFRTAKRSLAEGDTARKAESIGLGAKPKEIPKSMRTGGHEKKEKLCPDSVYFVRKDGGPDDEFHRLLPSTAAAVMKSPLAEVLACSSSKPGESQEEQTKRIYQELVVQELKALKRERIERASSENIPKVVDQSQNQTVDVSGIKRVDSPPGLEICVMNSDPEASPNDSPTTDADNDGQYVIYVVHEKTGNGHSTTNVAQGGQLDEEKQSRPTSALTTSSNRSSEERHWDPKKINTSTEAEASNKPTLANPSPEIAEVGNPGDGQQLLQQPDK